MGELVVTQSSSYPLEHKAPTNLLQSARSWLSQASSIRSSHLSFFNSSSPCTKWSVRSSLYFRWCPFQSGMWVAILAYGDNMADTSPPSVGEMLRHARPTTSRFSGHVISATVVIVLLCSLSTNINWVSRSTVLLSRQANDNGRLGVAEDCCGLCLWALSAGLFLWLRG